MVVETLHLPAEKLVKTFVSSVEGEVLDKQLARLILFPLPSPSSFVTSRIWPCPEGCGPNVDSEQVVVGFR